MNGPGRPGQKAAVLVGGAASLVAGVYLLEAIRPLAETVRHGFERDWAVVIGRLRAGT